jgi:hypothetical protein
MIRFTFLLFILLPLITHAQEIKKVTEKHTKPDYTEKYHILQSDGTTKHGQYTKTYSGLQEETGYYKNGFKDSLWTLTDLSDDHIIATGNYTNGIKTGIWTYYNNKDTIERQFDYSSSQLIRYLKDTAHKALVISGNDTTNIEVDRPPFRAIGNGLVLDIMLHNIRYPDDARENNQQGRVLIAVTVFSDGHTSPPWIKKGVAKSLDEEALRVANMIPFDCIPAILNGKPVTSIFIQPMSFKLE